MKGKLSIFLKSLIAVVVLLFVGSGVAPVFAQTDSTDTTYDDTWSDEDWSDWESDWESEWDYSYEYGTTELTDEEAEALGAMAFLFTGVGMVVALVVGVGAYVYSALVLSNIAKKLGHPKSWFAWVPVLNAVLLMQLGDQNPWLLLLVFIPVLGSLILMVIMIIAWMKIAEKRGYSNMMGLGVVLAPIIPVVGAIISIVLMGMLAWKDPVAPAKTESAPAPEKRDEAPVEKN